ncbi:hypothetical protein JCM10908_001797 [Rhodotorula pacifica]|uniref:uncharacterized protein n=1 Tax=Rhodotorula pacifica TaxID=1495444 RepID=UPI003171DEEA
MVLIRPAHKASQQDGWSTSLRDDDDASSSSADEANPRQPTTTASNTDKNELYTEGSDWDWNWSSDLVDIGLVQEPDELKFVETPFTLAKRNAAASSSSRQTKQSAPSSSKDDATAKKLAKSAAKTATAKSKTTRKASATKANAPQRITPPATASRSSPAASEKPLNDSSAPPAQPSAGSEPAPRNGTATFARPALSPTTPQSHVINKARLIASSGFRPAPRLAARSCEDNEGEEEPASFNKPLQAVEQCSASPMPAPSASRRKNGTSLQSDSPVMKLGQAVPDRSRTSSSPSISAIAHLLTDTRPSPTETTMPSSDLELHEDGRLGARVRDDSPCPSPVASLARPARQLGMSCAALPSELTQATRSDAGVVKPNAMRPAAGRPFVPPTRVTRPDEAQLPQQLTTHRDESSPCAHKSITYSPREAEAPVPALRPQQQPVHPASKAMTNASTPAPKVSRSHGQGISPMTRKRLDRFKRVGNFSTQLDEPASAAKAADTTAFPTPAAASSSSRVSTSFSLPGIGPPSCAQVKPPKRSRLDFTPSEPLESFRARHPSRPNLQQPSPASGRSFEPREEPVSPTPAGRMTGGGREKIVLGAAVRSVRPVMLAGQTGASSGSSSSSSSRKPAPPKRFKRPLAAPRVDYSAFGEAGQEEETQEAKRRRLYRSLGLSGSGLAC